MRRAVWAVLLLGCNSSPRRVGTPPSWRQSDTLKPSALPVVAFEPRTAGATHYAGEGQEVPDSALARATREVVSRVAGQLGLPAPQADGRLFAAMAELSTLVPDEGVIAYSLVEFALQRHGIVEPSPHLFVVWGDLGDPYSIAQQLEPKLPQLISASGKTRFAVGASRRPSGEGVVVFALQTSSVALRPIPRALPVGGKIRVEGEILAPFRDPEVFVTEESGSVLRLPVLSRGGLDFASEVDCRDRPGRRQIEVTAADSSGATVLANFPVWCLQDAPSSIRVDNALGDAAVTTTQEAEQRLLALVNHDRRAAGLPELVWDEQVASVARAHSQEMRHTGVVAHISVQTGSAADRVKNAGIRTAAVLENIARSYGIGEAHLGLMNSPGHRANLVSPLATHLGIGVVFGDEVAGRRELFVTQVFTRVPPRVDPGQVANEVRSKLGEVREVSTNARLEEVAQQVADQLARGVSRDAAWKQARGNLGDVAARFRRVGSVVTAVADLEAVTGASLLGGAQIDEIGIGIAQGPHADIGEQAVWIVVLLGQR
jgi:uncharacterized protein YkwD